MDFKRTSISFLCASLILTCAAFTNGSHSNLSKTDRKGKKKEHTLIISPTVLHTTSSHSFSATSSFDCFQTPFDFLSNFNFPIIAQDTVIAQTTSTEVTTSQEESNDILALLDEEASEKTNENDLELDTYNLDDVDFVANSFIITPQLLEKVASRENFTNSLVNLALKFEGTPYVAGGKSPKGFDCSGFVSYIYSRFKIKLPGSSISYDNVGKKVKLEEAQVGDVICFTGRNSRSGRTGHVGIIVENNPNEPIKFIHAASGSRRQITYSTMESAYYKTRFRSVRRISIPVVEETLTANNAE